MASTIMGCLPIFLWVLIYTIASYILLMMGVDPKSSIIALSLVKMVSYNINCPEIIRSVLIVTLCLERLGPIDNIMAIRIVSIVLAIYLGVALVRKIIDRLGIRQSYIDTLTDAVNALVLQMYFVYQIAFGFEYDVDCYRTTLALILAIPIFTSHEDYRIDKNMGVSALALAILVDSSSLITLTGILVLSVCVIEYTTRARRLGLNIYDMAQHLRYG